jgi:hypothetical protein
LQFAHDTYHIVMANVERKGKTSVRLVHCSQRRTPQMTA